MSPKSVTDHIYKRKGLFRKAKIQKGPDRGAIYIGNLPYGFYEEAIEKFFGQFGRITNLKVARSLKNAKPMGYAYIEFECEKVAEVVCETMDKYLMYNKILKCSFIPSNALNSKMFRNSDLTPEFCRGTIQKMNNQYEMVQSRGEKYEEKQKKKALKAFNFLKHTLGVKVESDLVGTE